MMCNNVINSSPNQMTLLLNKIERRLGTKLMNLPDEFGKDSWAEIIAEDTIPTFSRYFPYKITTIIDHTCRKDGFYFIDKNLPDGTVILGCKDIAWGTYRADPRFDRYGINFSTYDFISRDYNVEDIGLTQCSADFLSLFNLGIYIEFLKPNKIKLVSVNGSEVSRHNPFPVDVYIQHPISLMTIEPTMMETFEKLAISDVAIYLYENLKFYDGINTTFNTIDLHLDTIRDWAGRREEIVRELDEAHVSTANEFQSLIMTV